MRPEVPQFCPLFTGFVLLCLRAEEEYRKRGGEGCGRGWPLGRLGDRPLCHVQWLLLIHKQIIMSP